jgi:hypothetical protein
VRPRPTVPAVGVGALSLGVVGTYFSGDGAWLVGSLTIVAYVVSAASALTYGVSEATWSAPVIVTGTFIVLLTGLTLLFRVVSFAEEAPPLYLLFFAPVPFLVTLLGVVFSRGRSRIRQRSGPASVP